MKYAVLLNFMKPKTIKSKTLYKRLKTIHNIMDYIESRCMAADGPVVDFRHEVTIKELKEIYKLSDVEEFKIV